MPVTVSLRLTRMIDGNDVVIPVQFHIYVADFEATAVAKVEELRPLFDRMPTTHLQVLYPIFVVDRLPHGQRSGGGGTWRPSEVRARFESERRQARTGIPFADIERLVIDPGLGAMAIPRHRWERPARTGHRNPLMFTVFHEIGHNIDIELGLVPRPLHRTDFAGMETNRCGAGSSNSRKAVEAYSRVLLRPGRIYHALPHGERASAVNRALRQTLARAPAFTDVPESWWDDGPAIPEDVETVHEVRLQRHGLSPDEAETASAE